MQVNVGTKYKLNFEDSIPYKIISESSESENMQGVTFYLTDGTIDVLLSPIGYRILLNGIRGEWRDIPFHKGTFKFLPNNISVEEILETV